MTRFWIWIGVALRLGVAFWNGFYGPSFGAGGDAVGFHDIGVNFAETLSANPFHLGALYGYALGVVYFLTIPSLFWGGVLSCIAWWASARLLLRIMRLLALRPRQRSAAMMIYALLPSAVLWTGVTMREPYQLLLVNLAVLASLRIYLQRSMRHWLYLVTAIVLGGLLQPGLLLFGVLMLAATAFWLLLRKRRGIPVAKLLWVAPVAAVILVYGYSVFGSTYNFGLEGGLASAVESYQRGALTVDARTHYKEDVSIDGILGLLLFVPVAVFQYLFEPMPWRISALVDIPPLVENILRAWLLWRVVGALRRLPKPNRRPVMLVALAYAALEAFFAVGTVAWGTAIRHHIPSMGLLLAAAFSLPKARRRRVATPPPQSSPVPAAA
jgi:hypothetical protein